MNTKTTVDYTSDSYNGGTMGRDSPGALLDMLAEVASQTLHSEKKRIKSLLATQCKSKVDFVKRKPQETSFNVQQLLSMPASQLVKHFSIFTSDELKRQYSYTCALLPECGQKYISFASEGRARMSIKAHLAEHLKYLKTDKEAYNSFTARAVNCKKQKTNIQNKRGKLQQLKKPQEALNKENKDMSVDKSTNYLRKILLNDVHFKDVEKSKVTEKAENFKEFNRPEVKDTDRLNLKFLGDHSYFERIKDDMPNGKATSSFNDVLDNTTPEENIVLMVVGADGVHMKKYSHIKQSVSETTDQGSQTLYLSKIPWKEENCSKNIEATTTTKPKGKAKFIGTSKEEREMALAFMDRIKKKGNPTGNNLQCRICNPPRSFTAPTTLVSHYRSHAGIKPYECRICRAVFTRRHSLKYHMLIHQNQTRFTCADCGKKFRHPSHFREHRRRHTGEAPFGCDDCGQRFKTRNTYKRHLKTRHGKVLTTNGELLYLSEEDIQKVQTNRRKKSYCNITEKLVDEDIISSKTIINYEDNSVQQDIDIDMSEEYIINENDIDNNRDWGTEGTMQIIKDYFENYEVCIESHINETEPVETEKSVDTRDSDGCEISVKQDSVNKIQDNLPHLQTTFYDNVKIVENMQEEIFDHTNIDSKEKFLYNDAHQTKTCVDMQFEHNQEIKDETNILEYQENINFLEAQVIDNVQILQETEQIDEKHTDTQMKQEIELNNYNINCSINSNSDDVYVNDSSNNNRKEERYDTQIIISQDEDSINHFNIIEESHQEIQKDNADFCTEFTTLVQDINILQTINNRTAANLPPNENALERENEFEICHESDISKKTQENKLHITKHLYMQADLLKSIILQNKCVKILPYRCNSLHEQDRSTTQFVEYKKLPLLNKQSILLKQNKRQDALLLISGDTLKNGMLQVDKNSIVITGLKTANRSK